MSSNVRACSCKPEMRSYFSCRCRRSLRAKGTQQHTTTRSKMTMAHVLTASDDVVAAAVADGAADVCAVGGLVGDAHEQSAQPRTLDGFFILYVLDNVGHHCELSMLALSAYERSATDRGGKSVIEAHAVKCCVLPADGT